MDDTYRPPHCSPGTRTRNHRLLGFLAGAVAGCPGLEEVSAEPDGGSSGAAGPGEGLDGPPGRASEGQQRDLIPVRDRIGLGCALFPGCGAFMVALVTPWLLVVAAWPFHLYRKEVA